MTVKRGPGFPLFNLSDALNRARRIYDEEPHNEMASESAIIHMGYRGKSGTSLGAIATLRRYNLLEGRGDKIRVSRDAVTIFADESLEDQTARAEALRRCARSPEVFADLASAFKGIPATATIIPYLIKRGFTHSDADQIASNYRETMEFVENNAKAYTPEIAPDEAPERQNMMPQANVNQPNISQKSVSLPLSTNTWATLSAPFPLSSEAWERMIKVLDAMKPALIQEVDKEVK